MSRIVIATFGSLGDLHPKLAVGLELRRRGHDVTIAAMEFYREKIGTLGLGFHQMAPHMDPNDTGLTAKLVDAHEGTENMLRGIIFPSMPQMYADLMSACEGAELLMTGEVVYAAPSVVEKTGIKWASTSLSPISFFSVYDPPVPPQAPWLENLRFLGPVFHGLAYRAARWNMREWYEPYREFRRGLGLDPDHDPIFTDKFSRDLHLAMFSKVLAAPQPDWPGSTVQTGFCFHDGQQEYGGLSPGLEEFLAAGDAPIVFTLGSAAVMDARDFFEQSAAGARKLGRRAVVTYGLFNEPPDWLGGDIFGVGYAPFSLLFPRAACVVHPGGVGTTGQALRAGVPQLIMPYSHDQPDNAARCRRAGVAEVIRRDEYNAATAAKLLQKLLNEPAYREKAAAAKAVVLSEHGTAAACDAIERILLNPAASIK